MILRDESIKEWVRNGGISPINFDNVNPASIDLTLSHRWQQFEEDGTLTPMRDGNVVLWPYRPVLVSTREIVTLPNNIAGQCLLKSSTARMGVSMSPSGWVDPGFTGQLTFTLFSMVPAILTHRRRFIQLILMQLDGESGGYDGHYQGQRGPKGHWK